MHIWPLYFLELKLGPILLVGQNDSLQWQLASYIQTELNAHLLCPSDCCWCLSCGSCGLLLLLFSWSCATNANRCQTRFVVVIWDANSILFQLGSDFFELCWSSSSGFRVSVLPLVRKVILLGSARFSMVSYSAPSKIDCANQNDNNNNHNNSSNDYSSSCASDQNATNRLSSHIHRQKPSILLFNGLFCKLTIWTPICVQLTQSESMFVSPYNPMDKSNGCMRRLFQAHHLVCLLFFRYKHNARGWTKQDCFQKKTLNYYCPFINFFHPSCICSY